MKLRSAAALAFALCAMLAVAGDPPAPVKDAETARIEYLQGFAPLGLRCENQLGLSSFQT